jgi:hypothetical protein
LFTYEQLEPGLERAAYYNDNQKPDKAPKKGYRIGYGYDILKSLKIG